MNCSTERGLLFLPIILNKKEDLLDQFHSNSVIKLELDNELLLTPGLFGHFSCTLGKKSISTSK